MKHILLFLFRICILLPVSVVVFIYVAICKFIVYTWAEVGVILKQDGDTRLGNKGDRR